MRIVSLITAVSAMMAFPSFHSPAQPAASQHTAPKLTSAIVKQLGFNGVNFSACGTQKWKLRNCVVVYSTYPYGKAIRGFTGSTPLFIAVNGKGKIVAMAAAPNDETPEYFIKAKTLLKAWNGKTLKQAETHTPDVITGATFSSKAIIGTVHAAAAKLTD